jgi:hypothetical protein
MMVELPCAMTDPGNFKKAYLLDRNEEIQLIITLMCSKSINIEIIVRSKAKTTFWKVQFLAGLFMKVIVG